MVFPSPGASTISNVKETSFQRNLPYFQYHSLDFLYTLQSLLSGGRHIKILLANYRAIEYSVGTTYRHVSTEGVVNYILNTIMCRRTALVCRHFSVGLFICGTELMERLAQLLARSPLFPNIYLYSSEQLLRSLSCSRCRHCLISREVHESSPCPLRRNSWTYIELGLLVGLV